MRNHRFSTVTSNVILGSLVTVGSGIIWFAMQAYAEIAEIKPTPGVQSIIDADTAHVVKKNAELK